MYKIIRIFSKIDGRFQTKHRTIMTGLTLQEAQEHCRDPETASKTASPATLRRVARNNPGFTWFDGFEET